MLALLFGRRLDELRDFDLFDDLDEGLFDFEDLDFDDLLDREDFLEVRRLLALAFFFYARYFDRIRFFAARAFETRALLELLPLLLLLLVH